MTDRGIAVWLLRLACLAGALLAWHLIAPHAPRGVIPSPAQTWSAALKLGAEGRLWPAFVDTSRVYLGGMALAVAAGLPLGLLLGASRLLGRVADPFVNALAAMPRVAFIPLIIVILGLGPTAKTFIVFLGAVMPVLLNTWAGVRAADPELVEMARSTGAGRGRIWRHVMLPGALPFIVVGLRLGATIGLINTVVAELYTAVRGLGGLLAVYGNTFRMAEYFVVVLILAAIGVTVTEALRLWEARLTRWRGEGET